MSSMTFALRTRRWKGDEVLAYWMAVRLKEQGRKGWVVGGKHATTISSFHLPPTFLLLCCTSTSGMNSDDLSGRPTDGHKNTLGWLVECTQKATRDQPPRENRINMSVPRTEPERRKDGGAKASFWLGSRRRKRGLLWRWRNLCKGEPQVERKRDRER